MTRALLFLCLTFVRIASALAQDSSCPTLPQQVVVYFGNGILASPESSRRSMLLLRVNLGASYNNKTLRYDLAYNATDGMTGDLVQATRQAGVQWSSDLTNWLIRQELAPAWFLQWHRAELERFVSGLLPEIDQHVQSYFSDISLGQRVLVVAHSQGNFYANDARRLLQARLSADQMRRFAIYGVAVPANNVGGASGPYLTNHRDVIAQVPDALPANFTLRHGSGGVSADDVAPVQAHLFSDTYLSPDFNVRPVLLQGLRDVLDGFEVAPPAVCVDEVKASLLGQGRGSYRCYAFDDENTEVQVGPATVGRNGQFMLQGEGFLVDGSTGTGRRELGLSMSYDVTHPNVTMSFSRSDTVGMYFNAVQYEEGLGAQRVGVGSWSSTGEFRNLSVVEGALGSDRRQSTCDPTQRSPNDQSIRMPGIGEILSDAMQALAGPRRLRFEASECRYNVFGRRVEGPVEVDFNANALRINDVQVPWVDVLGATPWFLAQQRQWTGAGRFASREDFLPRLAGPTFSPEARVSFQADAIRGLRSMSFREGDLTLLCTKP